MVPPHAHHAIQVFFATEGKAAIRAGGEAWREARALIVRPDVEHSFNGQNAPGALLFVDPESSEGAWLQTSLAADITFVGGTLAPVGGHNPLEAAALGRPLLLGPHTAHIEGLADAHGDRQ